MKTAPILDLTTYRGTYRTPRHYQPRAHAEDCQERARRGLINGLRISLVLWAVIAGMVGLTWLRFFSVGAA